ncbi:uncharacterized protein LOC130591327 [Beta vulgaris subsp. vulgaris]|uniref:uncharacterized protein LOC130591327 n=1 Tax=Beta vulgaris subsp. vulgaris TaxID=3555 RepID=UPI002547C8EB|nr:uncharacterized protein LOC130591327 [Beta vulgaris subsp. vulgaris]
MRSVDRDNLHRPFGGKVIVFVVIIRQILPVVPKGTRQDIVFATVNSSYLWDSCKVLRLTRNMRLQSGSSKSSVDELREFSEWILSVGDGNAGGPNDGEAVIEIAKDILIDPGPIRFQQLLKAREERVYLSSDAISKEEGNFGVHEIYSTEFLNTIKCSGLPNHSIRLKVGAPLCFYVILIKHLDYVMDEVSRQSFR